MRFLDALADAAAGWAAAEPQRRPGSHLFLTAGQWDTHDELAALRERQEERYGPLTGFADQSGLRAVRGRVLL